MPGDPRLRKAAAAGARVSVSALTIMLVAFAGAQADEALDTTPWLFFAGLTVGSILGLANLLRGLLEPDDDDPSADPPQ